MKNKFWFLAIIAVCLTLTVSCKKNNDVSGSTRKTYYLKDGGSTVSNPTGSEMCIQPNAAQTLQSLRYIDGLVYRMDYYSPNMLDSLIDADCRRYTQRDSLINRLYFTEEGWEESLINPQACSGFVCKNEKGDLLFCRNFDGSDGACLALFDQVNGYRRVMMTAPYYNSVLYHDDNALRDGKTSLHRLMRQHIAVMDGMNEYGLCYGAFQLPDFAYGYPDSLREYLNSDELNQNTGKKAIDCALFHNMLLSRCKTVKDVEQMLTEYDMVSLIPYLNVHWLIADATGDWAIFEYWGNELHVYREEDLKKPEMVDPDVPYEWCSIENYYRNPECVANFKSQEWQTYYSTKKRITNMMKSYKPVMTLEEALACSQEGIYYLESDYEGELTNWSCIYNPKELTIHFYNRNDTSKLYVIDLKREFNME